MYEKLKEVFNQIQAEEELKSKTKSFVTKKTKGYTRKKAPRYRYFVPAVACMALLLFGGHWLYFSPVVEISIDINPSMELGINRLDRVISIESYNEDGQEFINSLDLKYTTYSEAVKRIVEHDDMAALLSDDEIMTIAVFGSDEAQSSKIFSNIQAYTAGKSNTYCYCAQMEEVEEAHDMGLSYGKYKAYLEVEALDPNITVEEIENMTMRQIRDLIEGLSDDRSGEINGNGNGYQGTGNGNGWGQMRNKGSQ